MTKFYIAQSFWVCSFFLSVNVCFAQTDPLYIDPSGKVGIGTNKPSTSLDVNGGVKATTLEVNGEIKSNALEVRGRIRDQTGFPMPVGSIVAFAGKTKTPPEGWLLCDGQDLKDNPKYKELIQVINGNSTPDLRSKHYEGYIKVPYDMGKNQPQDYLLTFAIFYIIKY